MGVICIFSNCFISISPTITAGAFSCITKCYASYNARSKTVDNANV